MKKKNKRVGRGPGSGHGKTAGRGQKGQKARSKTKLWFEGGQMPIQRRIPKRGFTNIFKKKYQIVNLSWISEKNFKEKEEVTPEKLAQARLIKKDKGLVKVLGKGELTKPLFLKANAFSRSASRKIKEAGGRIQVV